MIRIIRVCQTSLRNLNLLLSAYSIKTRQLWYQRSEEQRQLRTDKEMWRECEEKQLGEVNSSPEENLVVNEVHHTERGSGGMCLHSLHVCSLMAHEPCVHPSGLSLGQRSHSWVCSYITVVFWFFFSHHHPLSSLLYFASLSLHMCLFSHSITFGSSPGQTVKCCNLSLSPILTLPPSLPPSHFFSQPPSEPLRSWITVLTATCKRGKSLTKSRSEERRRLMKTYLEGWG